jgi:hypothetical protein
LRGVRKRPPPFGWDFPDDAPVLGWRRQKEVIGGLHDEGQAPSPAMQFLNPARYRALTSPEPARAPAPAAPAVKRGRGRPCGSRASPQGEAGHSQPIDATAVDRQRARRSRQAQGKIWVPTEIEEVAWVEELVSAGFLDRGDAEDRRAIGAALSRFLDVVIRVELVELVAASRRDNS